MNSRECLRSLNVLLLNQPEVLISKANEKIDGAWAKSNQSDLIGRFDVRSGKFEGTPYPSPLKEGRTLINTPTSSAMILMDGSQMLIGSMMDGKIRAQISFANSFQKDARLSWDGKTLGILNRNGREVVILSPNPSNRVPRATLAHCLFS